MARPRFWKRATHSVVVLFVSIAPPDRSPARAAGCDGESARALATGRRSGRRRALPQSLVEPIGRAPTGQRFVVLSTSRSLAGPTLQRFRTLCAVLRQGFDLCEAA
jgi:hypothetical protein